MSSGQILQGRCRGKVGIYGGNVLGVKTCFFTNIYEFGVQ